MTEREVNDRIEIRSDFPQPTVDSDPQIFAKASSLSIRYYTADGGIALIRFPLVDYLLFGSPNDEALGGHPLAKHGLQFYSVHEVKNSSLIKELERRNSIHPKHNRESFFEHKRHYLFTFQDTTLECVVSEGKWWAPTVKIVNSEQDADSQWPECKEV